jgi:thiosulfate dehydrogenase [quinone] large subunit
MGPTPPHQKEHVVTTTVSPPSVPTSAAPTSRAAAATPIDPTEQGWLPAGSVPYLWAAVRLSLGWTFLWPFLDKTFGLGHETPAASAWIDGGSPTTGFLAGAAGPFAGIYHWLSGAIIADYGFMAGLLAIGVALLLGIGTRVAAVSGAVLLLLMWTASLPPDNNPFMDDHIIYALVLIGIAHVGAGTTLGFGRRWAETDLVARHPWLR